MSVKVTKKQEPEDMVLRLIRVAEILVKGEGDSEESVSHAGRKSVKKQTGASSGHEQKTQT